MKVELVGADLVSAHRKAYCIRPDSSVLRIA